MDSKGVWLKPPFGSKSNFYGKLWINLINFEYVSILNIHTHALYLILLFNKSILLHAGMRKIAE